jgi:hypothetical protein
MGEIIKKQRQLRKRVSEGEMGGIQSFRLPYMI